MGAFDPRKLRLAFGSFMTGVTVVAARNADGVPVGFTANSYTSVSLEPPLLLVCPARGLSSFSAFNTCAHFAVSVLAEAQREVADIFAGGTADRFTKVAWRADDWGCPLIERATAAFSCAVRQRVEAGDHVILIGEIKDFAASGAAGLGYLNGGYFSLELERRAAEMRRPSRPVTVGAIIEYNDQVLIADTPAGRCPPQTQAGDKTDSLTALRTMIARAGLNVQFGPAYSIFENNSGEHYTYYRGVAADGESGGLGRYLPVAALATVRYTSEALADMLRRYVRERQSGNFGLYVGDEQKGDVHLSEARVRV